MATELSGPQWVSRFPTSTLVTALAQPFQGGVSRFITALNNAGAQVSISATYRPAERAYLMHYAYRIAREHFDPAHVPAHIGVNITWMHTNAQGQPDVAASRKAAEQMVAGYHIVHRPSLTSRHTQRLAIDMNISWTQNLVVLDAGGHQVTITSVPRTGAGNHNLHTLGASYGVQKLQTDPPHWSNDGH